MVDREGHMKLIDLSLAHSIAPPARAESSGPSGGSDRTSTTMLLSEKHAQLASQYDEVDWPPHLGGSTLYKSPVSATDSV
jgi:hypothetical protein